MKTKLYNAAKDFGFGIATVLGVIGIISAFIGIGELVGATSDTIRLALAIPFFLYFTYIFGGLTRSIYFKKD
jgi:hypothetical protein|tara:strand:+ start:6216 stop:6431 length:216 start_codon:yes stop_codon:yes gene_type:complete